MAIPTPDKTWNFSVNNAVGGLISIDADNKQDGYTLITAFLTMGWTIRSSCDSVNFGNEDGYNWITSASKIIFNTAGSAHSWIVLQNTALAAKAAILIDFKEPLGGGQKGYTVTISTTGFGLANSGTNGTATAAPTAAAATSWVVLASNIHQNNAIFKGTMHYMWSSDGECSRIIYTDHSSNNDIYGILCIEKAKTPCSEWTVPVFTIGIPWNSAVKPQFSTLCNTNTYTLSKIGGTAVNLYLTGESVGTTLLTENTNIPIADDPSTGFPILPMGIACAVVGQRNWRKGLVYDLWWGSYQVSTGNTYPVSPVGQLRKFIQIGYTVFPWNGLSIVDGTAIDVS